MHSHNVRPVIGVAGSEGGRVTFRMRAIVDRPTRYPRFLGALIPRIAPGRVLRRHAHDEHPDE